MSTDMSLYETLREVLGYVRPATYYYVLDRHDDVSRIHLPIQQGLLGEREFIESATWHIGYKERYTRPWGVTLGVSRSLRGFYVERWMDDTSQRWYAGISGLLVTDDDHEFREVQSVADIGDEVADFITLTKEMFGGIPS